MILDIVDGDFKTLSVLDGVIVVLYIICFALLVWNKREAAGVTQKELAEYLDVYQKDISRWENGEQIPNALTFAKICKALGASADKILEL